MAELEPSPPLTDFIVNAGPMPATPAPAGAQPAAPIPQRFYAAPARAQPGPAYTARPRRFVSRPRSDVLLCAILVALIIICVCLVVSGGRTRARWRCARRCTRWWDPLFGAARPRCDCHACRRRT